MSDHGYHMGEHGHVGKRMNYGTSTHIPLIMKIPGVKPATVNEVVESIDVFPTLVEAAGFGPMPVCEMTPLGTKAQADFCTEGSSMLKMLRQQGNHSWSNEAYSQELGNFINLL